MRVVYLLFLIILVTIVRGYCSNLTVPCLPTHHPLVISPERNNQVSLPFIGYLMHSESQRFTNIENFNIYGRNCINQAEMLTPIGAVETYCDNVSGWAYDPGDPSKSLQVGFYIREASSGNLLQFIIIQANLPSPDINAAQGITGNHRFSFKLPPLFCGQTVRIEVYVDDASGTSNAWLGTGTCTVSSTPDIPQFMSVDGAAFQQINTVSGCSGQQILLDMGGFFGTDWTFKYTRPDGAIFPGGTNGVMNDQIVFTAGGGNSGTWKVTYTSPSGCLMTKEFMVNSRTYASVQAIQASCYNGVIGNDGSIKITVKNAAVDKIGYSTGSTYTGPSYGAATAIGSTPFTVASNIANPSSPQAYTVRVFAGSSTCYEDYHVTLNPQDCQYSCDCKDYLYLAEPSMQSIHKFNISQTIPFTEVMVNSNPWYPGGGASELPSPHGLVNDLNGNFYSTDVPNGSGQIRRLDAFGNIKPTSEFSIPDAATNLVSIGNTIYLNPNSYYPGKNGHLFYYSLCDASKLGEACFAYADGTPADGSWELKYNPTTGNFVAGHPNAIWRFTKADIENSNATGTCIRPLINKSTDGVVSVGDKEILNRNLPGNTVWGVTEDNSGNIYVNESSYYGISTRLWKFDSNGGFIKTSAEDTNPYDGGYCSALGIVYHSGTNRIYASVYSGLEDCISAFDTDLNYLGAAVPPTGINGFGYGKALNILKDCCPSNSNLTIDKVSCNAPLGQRIFLQDLISCQANGVVTEGQWTPDPSNTGISYNECDNSIIINEINGCGTFTLSSTGGQSGSRCGAFDLSVKVTALQITTPIISNSQSICPNTIPTALSITTPASGSGTISYKWQQNLTGCNGLWTDISGATGLIYSPLILTQTTYFRVIATIANNCTGETCSQPSNCITISMDTAPSCSISINSQPTCANLTGGSIIVNPSPAGTYSYKWNDIGSGSASRSGLAAGQYTVTVTNIATGCFGVCNTTLNTPTGCCNINAVTAINLECLDNNTPSKITDNRIRFSAQVTNTNALLTGYNVTINGGTTITPNANVPYGVTQFTLGAGTAGGGATFTVTVTDSATLGCTQTFQVVDPGNCTPAILECPPVKCGTATIQVNGN